MTRAAAILVALLALAGCDRRQSAATAPPAKGKANLTVTVVAKPKTGAKAFRSYKPTEADKAEQAASKGNFELVDYDHLSDIVVWAEPSVAAKADVPPTLRISFADKAPSPPPLYALDAGATMNFTNTGAKPLRLYSVSEGNEFDTGPLKPGEAKDRLASVPGLIELLDGDTYEPVARIYVASGSDARIVRAGEATTFRNLAPGAYRVVAWHERVPGNERQVTLGPDDAKEFDLLIGVNALPKVE